MASRADNYLALCLLDALDDGNLESVRVLLEKHRASPNTLVLDKNVAPIHLVVGIEDREFAVAATELMLRHGADFNLRSIDEGMTPMHVAANLGRADIVSLLMRAGAKLDMADADGLTPVEYAIEEGHVEVVQLLQNFIFEQKIDRKRKKLLEVQQKQQQQQQPILTSPQPVATGVRYIKCLGGYLTATTPTKAVQALEENKLTPRGVHYNFDVTSPYYINITHRRKDRKMSIDRSVLCDEGEKENVATPERQRQNLFELTERNLKHFSRLVDDGGKQRTSFIESWRQKIADLRDQCKRWTNMDNIEKVLAGFSEESRNRSELELEASILTDSEATKKLSEVPAAETFYSAVADQVREDSFKTNEFLRPLTPASTATVCNVVAAQPNPIVQISEEYIHTDDEAGLVFYEKKFLTAPVQSAEVPQVPKTNLLAPRNPSISSLSTVVTLPPLDYDTDALRVELTNFGEPPGPITKHTKKLYLKKLIKFRRHPERQLQRDKETPNYSVELFATLRNEDIFQKITDHQPLEVEMSAGFTSSEKSYREGHLKKSFIYLLIDPRLSDNLAAQQQHANQHDLWRRFLASIFYVGKGKSSRPYCHLYDAMKLYHQKSIAPKEADEEPASDPAQMELQIEEERIIFQSDERIEKYCRTTKVIGRKQMNDSAKLNKIIDVWRSGKGIVCLHVFHNIMPAEAYTREAAIIDAIGIQNLTNLKRGDYYGKSLSWPMRKRKHLGILLLHKAMRIILAEGETQLLPCDLI